MGRKQRLKKQQNRENKTDKGQQRGTLYWVIFAGLCILMFYPPYFRGLFFDRELLPTHMFTAVLFGLWWIYKYNIKHDTLIFKTPMDYFALAMVGVYFISFFTAANPRLAVGELLKYINYFMVYWIVGEIVEDHNTKKILLYIMVLSAVGVAFLGIGAAAGTFSYNGAFVDGRINSSIQYPNTLAAYLTAAYVILLFQYSRATAIWERVFLAVSGFILFFTFIFTFSRGGLLVFPLIYILYLIRASNPARLKALKNLLIVLLVSGICYIGFNRGISVPETGKPWVWFALGVLLTAVIDLILGSINVTALGKRARYAVIASAGLSIAGLIILFFQRYSQLSLGLLNRLFQLSLTEANVLERITYYRDAFKIIKDNPVIGAGGGGWAALYHGYQSYEYWSNQVHNYFIQVWVETGTLGFLVLIGLWVTFIFSVIKIIMMPDIETGKKDMTWAVFTSAAALGIHSIIDFNLTLGAVSLFLWGLFGITRSSYIECSGPKVSPKNLKEATGSKALIGIVCSILILFISTCLFAGYSYGQKAVQNLTSGDAVTALRYFEKASRLDPLTASFRADAAQIYDVLSRSQDEKDYIKKAEELFTKAVNLDKYNPRLYAHLGSFYLRHGDIDKGLSALEKAVKLHPYNLTYHEYLADAYKEVGRIYLLNNQLDEGKDILGKALDIPTNLLKLNRDAAKKIRASLNLVTNIEKCKMFLENAGNTREIRQINDYILIDDFNFDIDGDGSPDIWKVTPGSSSNLQMKDGVWSISRLTKPVNLDSEDFILSPQNLYSLGVRLRGNNINTVEIQVIDKKTNKPVYNNTIPVNERFGEHQLLFNTGKGIENDNSCYIRIIIKGSPNTNVEIDTISLKKE